MIVLPTRWRSSFLLAGCVAVTQAPAVAAQDDYAAPILAGIGNRGQTGSKPYVAAGDRAYLIGTQDGDFPDMGEHLSGEMGGLWVHPIKLIDGFWAEVTDLETGQNTALSRSTEFINYPYGNRFTYGAALDGLEIERFQFSPDGQPAVVVAYTFKNAADRERRLRLRFSVKTDLRPVWYSEHLGLQDARDTVGWRQTGGLFVARDTGHDWTAVWGATPVGGAEPVAHPPPVSTAGMGATAAADHRVFIAPHDSSTLAFVIAGSTMGPDAALAAYRYVAAHHQRLLARKVAHYASIIETARVTIPDRRLQEVYNWVRVNAEWLVRDVPGIGRGLGGGLMEYPWWFGTETYSLQALTAAGDHALAKAMLRLMRTQSVRANGNGRIVHEVTTNGAVVNPGNTQETAQFILTVGKVVAWSGDLAFAREMYPAMKKGLTWLLTDMDTNRNLFPEGYGIMEVSGLNAELIDVAVYTQQALEATAGIAHLLGDAPSAARYRRLAADLKARINERFWVEEDSSYADFYGSRAQAISAADGAIRQIRLKGTNNLTRRDEELLGYYERLKPKFAAMPDTNRGWLTNQNWVITTPMETGIAPRERALGLLERIRREHTGPYGPFLSATERQAMMTISTGVQAVSEANYGRTDQALWYVNKIVETFGRVTPGSISEMMPDYGCFVIAWTSYGVLVPLIQHVFGVRPDAVHKSVVFDPHVPSGWENMSIEDLPIGGNVISFARAKTGAGVEYRIDSRHNGWTFVLKAEAEPGATYYLNGELTAPTASGIRMTGRTNRVLIATTPASR